MRSRSTPQALATADWVNQISSNSTQRTAYSLGTVSGPEPWTGLSIQQDNDEEWFAFTIGAGSGLADSVAISFDPSLGQLDLALFNTSSSTAIDSSSTIGGSEVISLSGMAAGTYDVEVYGAANPDYTLTVTAPGRTAVDAIVEQQNGKSDNNSFADAFDLGTPSGAESIGPLSLLKAGENDWFKFNIPSGVTADSSDFVGIVLDDTLGDLQVQLFNSSMTPEGQSGSSLSDFEQISLAGLSGGTSAGGTYYYVDVFGHDNATNPEYDLVLQTPNTTAPANPFGPNPINSAKQRRLPSDDRRRPDFQWFGDRCDSRHEHELVLLQPRERLDGATGPVGQHQLR